MVAVRLVAGGDDLLTGRLRLAVGDIIRHRPAEKPGILQYHTEQPSHIFAAHGGYVVAVYRDPTALNIVEPHQKVHQRRLARTGGPHDCHLLSVLHVYGKVTNKGRFGVITEVHIPEIYIALYLLRQVPLNGLLLRCVLHLVHPSGGGTGTLHRTQHPRDLLQRGRELAGVQQHRYHGAHAQSALHRQVAADEGDQNVSQCVGGGNARRDQSLQKQRLRLGVLLPPVCRGMRRDGGVLVVIRLGGLVAGIALLHHRVHLSALLKHAVEIGAAGGGDTGGNDDGKRHEQQDRQPHTPVFPQHHHGNDHDLHKTHHRHIYDVVDTAAHVGDIFLDPVDNLTGRGLIDKADGQPSQLIRKLDTQVAGVVFTHHIVHQVHLANIHNALHQVHPCQRPADRQQRGGQSLGGALARPCVVQKLHALPQQLGRDDSARHHHAAQQGAQQQPAVNGLRVPHQTAHHRPGAHFSFFGRVLFAAHRRSPPVWER